MIDGLPIPFGEMFERKDFNGIVNTIEGENSEKKGFTVYDRMIYAASLFHLQNFTSCINELSSLEGPFANDPSFYSLYGAALRRIGVKESAYDMFKKAIELSGGKDVFILNNYANLLIDLDRKEEAKKILQDIIKKNPDYLDARVNLERLAQDNTSFYAKATDAQLADFLIDPLMVAFSNEQLSKEINANVLLDAKKLPKTAKKFAKRLGNQNKEVLMQEKLDLLNQALKEDNFDFGFDLVAELKTLGLPKDLAYKYYSDCLIGKQNYYLAEIALLHSMLLEQSDVNAFINMISLCAMRGDIERAQDIFDQIKERPDLTLANKDALLKTLTIRSKELEGSIYKFA